MAIRITLIFLYKCISLYTIKHKSNKTSENTYSLSVIKLNTILFIFKYKVFTRIRKDLIGSMSISCTRMSQSRTHEDTEHIQYTIKLILLHCDWVKIKTTFSPNLTFECKIILMIIDRDKNRQWIPGARNQEDYASAGVPGVGDHWENSWELPSTEYKRTR